MFSLSTHFNSLIHREEEKSPMKIYATEITEPSANLTSCTSNRSLPSEPPWNTAVSFRQGCIIIQTHSTRCNLSLDLTTLKFFPILQSFNRNSRASTCCTHQKQRRTTVVMIQHKTSLTGKPCGFCIDTKNLFLAFDRNKLKITGKSTLCQNSLHV